ncbi:MAG: hypothetical protein K8F91_05950 [Candidatus Obscuribacterales bacterium]|nr:hypothetical protein [Candidatus Obscuribacterales bacterium]
MDDKPDQKPITYKGKLIAFVVPFLIVTGCSVLHWYNYGLQDIHSGRLRVWKEGDKVQQPGDHWELLKFALIVGSASGIAAGTLGLGLFALTRSIKQKS